MPQWGIEDLNWVGVHPHPQPTELGSAFFRTIWPHVLHSQEPWKGDLQTSLHVLICMKKCMLLSLWQYGNAQTYKIMNYNAAKQLLKVLGGNWHAWTSDHVYPLRLLWGMYIPNKFGILLFPNRMSRWCYRSLKHIICDVSVQHLPVVSVRTMKGFRHSVYIILADEYIAYMFNPTISSCQSNS